MANDDATDRKAKASSKKLIIEISKEWLSILFAFNNFILCSSLVEKECQPGAFVIQKWIIATRAGELTT